MQDINKLIQAENLAHCEAAAFLQDLEPWSEEQAQRAAQAEHMELGEAHMDVLCWLRDYYADCGPATNARALLSAMEEAFAQNGGKRYLFKLFPGGPVTQGSRLAGLPIPPGSVDPSFGSTH